MGNVAKMDDGPVFILLMVPHRVNRRVNRSNRSSRVVLKRQLALFSINPVGSISLGSCKVSGHVVAGFGLTQALY